MLKIFGNAKDYNVLKGAILAIVHFVSGQVGIACIRVHKEIIFHVIFAHTNMRKFSQAYSTSQKLKDKLSHKHY